MPNATHIDVYLGSNESGQELLAGVEAIARDEGVSVSAIIRTLILKEIHRREKRGNHATP